MIDRPLDDIRLTDIEALCTYARSEGPTLDFKESFPLPTTKVCATFSPT